MVLGDSDASLILCEYVQYKQGSMYVTRLIYGSSLMTDYLETFCHSSVAKHNAKVLTFRI